MNSLLSLAILLFVGLLFAFALVWLSFPFFVKRLLKSLDERLYYVNIHLLENNRLLANIEQWLEFQNRPPPLALPPPLPPPPPPAPEVPSVPSVHSVLS